MITKKNLPVLCCAVLFFLLFGPRAAISAEILLSDQWGYAVDLPEGYVLEEKSGAERYRFSHELFPVTLQIALYERAQFPGAVQMLKHVTSQYGSEGPEAPFTWRFREAAIAQLKFSGGAGWALCLELAGERGWLVLAVHTAEDKALDMEAVMISTLDSAATDHSSWREPGPMTSFAWFPEKETAGTVACGGRTRMVPFNSVDQDANQAIVNREFSLLTAYLNTPLVYPAWNRYYRMIYRDAWKRIERAAFVMESCLPETAEEKTASILSWTQEFTYERDRDGADFMNIPQAFMTRTGDCDSRALLMVLLLKQMGVDAILLVSPEFSHALAAVDCPGTGARFSYEGKDYLIADTTAKVAPGRIASDMADPDKWFAVSFHDPALP